MAPRASGRTHDGAGPPPDGPPLWRKCLIFATYSVSIWCVGLPPPLYPAMQKDLGFSSGAVAGILAFETAGTAVGKTFAGFYTDAVGARTAYMLTALALACVALAFSYTSSVATISLAVFVLEVVNAPAWPAHARLLHGWYPRRLLSDGVWVLSMSSRSTDMATKLAYGSLVNKWSWRAVARVGILIGCAGACLACFHRDSPRSVNVRGAKMSRAAFVRGARRMLCSKSWWAIALAVVCSTIVKRMGQFVPVFFHDAAPGLLSEGDAAELAVVFQPRRVSAELFFRLNAAHFTATASMLILAECSVLLRQGWSCPRPAAASRATASRTSI